MATFRRAIDQSTSDGPSATRGVSPARGNFQIAKEGWLKEVARHPNLSGADYAVAIMLSTYFNSRTRQAWPSLDTLAADTNRNRSTIWRSINRLEELKLLRIERARGRTRSHRYSPEMGEIERDPKTLRRRNKMYANSQQKDCDLAVRTSEEV